MSHIEKLVDGFKRFRGGRYAQHHDLFERLATQGQAPKTVVVGCCDSRVDPAIVTDCDPGDLFTIRNVANLVPPYETSGSFHGTSAALEFAVCDLAVENIIVLGHSQCGGIRGLMLQDTTTARNNSFVKDWMRVAAHARNRVLARMQGESQEACLRACEQEAILISLDNLLTFPWVLERVMQKKLTLHGWYFDMDRIALMRYDSDSNRFVAFE